MRCTWLLLQIIFGVTVTVDSQTCDPNGAISSCMQNMCTDKYEEIPSALCAMMELRCCRFMCDGPGTLFVPNLSDCASLGMLPRLASVECWNNGMCCAWPGKPQNWPEQYPWPPYQGWPPGFVFPASYELPRIWPNGWKPIPASAYPQHEHQLAPTPNPVYFGNSSKSESQQENIPAQKPALAPVPAQKPTPSYPVIIRFGNSTTTESQSAQQTTAPPMAAAPAAPAQKQPKTPEPPQGPSNSPPTIPGDFYNLKALSNNPELLSGAQYIVTALQQTGFNTTQAQSAQPNGAPPMAAAPPVQKPTSPTPVLITYLNTTTTESQSGQQNVGAAAAAPQKPTTAILPPVLVAYLNTTTKGSQNAAAPMGAAPAPVLVPKPTAAAPPVSSRYGNATENQSGQQNTAAPPRKPTTPRPTPTPIMYRVIPLSYGNITEIQPGQQDTAPSVVKPTAASPVSSTYGNATENQNGKQNTAAPMAAAPVQKPTAASPVSSTYGNTTENQNGPQNMAAPARKPTTPTPVSSSYNDATSDTQNQEESADEETPEAAEGPSTPIPPSPTKGYNLTALSNEGSFTDEEQDYIIKALQDYGYHVQQLGTNTNPQNVTSPNANNGTKPQGQPPKPPAAGPPAGAPEADAPPAAAPPANGESQQQESSKPVQKPSANSANSANVKVPPFPSVWNPSNYDYRPGLGPTGEPKRKPKPNPAKGDSNQFSNKPTYPPAAHAANTSNVQHNQRKPNYARPPAAGSNGNNVYRIPTYPPKLRQSPNINNAGQAGAEEGKSADLPEDQSKPVQPPRVIELTVGAGDTGVTAPNPMAVSISNAPGDEDATLEGEEKEKIHLNPPKEVHDKMEEKIKKIVYKVLYHGSKHGKHKKRYTKRKIKISSAHREKKRPSVFPVFSSFP